MLLDRDKQVMPYCPRKKDRLLVWGLLELLAKSVQWSATVNLSLTVQGWYFCLACGKYTVRAGGPGIVEHTQK